jgi:hypothetical protein
LLLVLFGDGARFVMRSLAAKAVKPKVEARSEAKSRNAAWLPGLSGRLAAIRRVDVS